MVRRHPEAPPSVVWLVRTLEEAGFETWAVGGAVRDVLLGRTSVDWDFATRARPRQVRRCFRRTVPIGIEHGTVGVLSRDGTLYEVTTFRKDVETFGRHAVVEFADSLDDDLARRDFTINAVAWHPLRDELHDPWDGIGDLERGLLRTVGDPVQRFAEDYLRVLRALRFAARYDLRIEGSAWAALVEAVDHLDVLSIERVREELVKVLEKDPRPSGALGLYAASGVLDAVAPELGLLIGADPVGPGSGVDRWARACLAADLLPPEEPLLRLAALLADGGRGDGRPGPGEPDEEAGRRAAALMSRLRFSNAATDRVVGVARAGRPPGPDVTPADARRWLSRVGAARLRDVARVWSAGARVRAAIGRTSRAPEGNRLAGRAGPDPVADTAACLRALRRERAVRPPLAVGDLALDGRGLIALGLRPGPRFGEILDDLLARVIEDPGLNVRERLESLVLAEIGRDEANEG